MLAQYLLFLKLQPIQNPVLKKTYFLVHAGGLWLCRRDFSRQVLFFSRQVLFLTIAKHFLHHSPFPHRELKGALL
jgi:hypothetical protein